MFSRINNTSSTLVRPQLLSVVVLLCMCVLLISGCVDDAPASVSPKPSKPTNAAAKPTRTAKPAANATSKPATAAQNKGADWTVLVYLAADNNLESYAIADYMEMASVGSNDRVNIVVQMDRISAPNESWDDTSNGDWDTAKRFHVERGKKPTMKNQLADLGELDMGDPKVLGDFITWGMKAYPAKRTALVFWDHGAAWPGVASDDSSDGDMITLPELGDAMSKAQKSVGFDKLDLIGFDACLMGQLDVLRSVKDYGRVAIGSADLEPGDGWAWNVWLRELVDNPSMDAAAVSPSIIKSFQAFYKNEDEPNVTLAAFDLSKIDALTSRLDALANVMIDNMGDSYKAIARARSYAIKYAPDESDDFSSIDLGHFAKLLTEQRTSKPIASAADDLLTVLKTTRISQAYGKAYRRNATGLSIYFPRKAKYYEDDYKQDSLLASQTRWDDFLKLFFKGGRAKTERSSVSKLALNTAETNSTQPVTVHASIGSADTAHVSYFIGAVQDADPNTLLMLRQDFVYPPGTTPNDDVPSWDASTNDVSVTWHATSWFVSNGSATSEVALSPIRYGSNVYSVEGIYASQKTGKTRAANLNFEVVGGKGRLLHVWGYTYANGKKPQPAELQPKPGDTFTPEIITTTIADGKETAQGAAPSEPITFGDTPLVVFEGPAPAGQYKLGLRVENVDGEINSTYADVTVANGNTTMPPVPTAAPAPVAGTQPGTLTYSDEKLNLRIDYPQSWQPLDVGEDSVSFANPDDESGLFLNVDAYALDGTPAAASKSMLQVLMNEFAKEQGFEQRGSISNVKLTDGTAKSVEYIYTDEDGVRWQGRSVAFASKRADALYLIMFEAPADRFDATLPTFTHMVDSFQVTKS